MKRDMCVFHSVKVPIGSGMNFSNGITPFVLANNSNGNLELIAAVAYKIPFAGPTIVL